VYAEFANMHIVMDSWTVAWQGNDLNHECYHVFPTRVVNG